VRVYVHKPEHPTFGQIVALVDQPGNLPMNFDPGGCGIFVEAPDLRNGGVLEAVVDLV